MSVPDTGAPPDRYRRLRAWNVAMGALHLAQGVAILALSTGFALPVTTSFLGDDPARRSIPAPELAFNVELAPLIAAFLFLSAVAHLLTALPRVYQWYLRNLEREINFIRWYEYALSSSVMIVVIAMLAGMWDGPSLTLIFALNASMILFGLVMEKSNTPGKRVDWTAYYCGVVTGIVAWIVIAIYLIGATAASGGRVPTFVYFIFGTLLVFFALFPLNMLLQYRKRGRWRDYLFGERAYIFLSLTAKSALAWQVFAGTLR